ncbi:NAD(P)H nitroreductase [Nocardioides flavus (ex Wang et al. 2016)]|uniref:NAD(P)H nitroreductase n=1 Tax=Nocardioides flavus (ex Wang et al. 2016) TaxID=2058780 RepID=A0ABQ3HT53_9ACTN|nr:NAD(P)H nitroreductase [Nocardioides flavus (ex Wang et al. 2016)]GHE19005.1 NAD(P)H nitroreductase [Nocardioides flavus (ex Wang et al. 2016)]
MTATRLVPVETLHRIVEVATRAPSVHNTQPWLWRGGSHTLELFADRRYQLSETDPLGRNLTISCGAALHQAQVAAGALGWSTRVARHPDPAEPDLLAVIELSAGVASPTAQESLDAMDARCTDRRRFNAWPVPEERLAHLARIAHQWGARAVALTDESERYIAERLVRRAADQQRANPAIRAEQEHWLHRPAGDGVPAGALPDQVERAGRHAHRFEDAAREVHPGAEVEATDGLIVFFDTHDDPAAWLRVGEGLSAMWLGATLDGLCLVPLSQVIEVPETLQAFQVEVLGSLAHPLLLVRVGWRPTGGAPPDRTLRRPVSEVLELV